MTQAYIITEGAFAAELLRRVLPEALLPDIHIVSRERDTEAITAARTLLVTRKRPVLVVINFNAVNGPTQHEQLYLARELLYAATPGVQCEAFIANPESEAAVVQDREVLRQLVQRPVTDEEWNTARQTPRATLTRWLGSPDAVIDALDHLTDDALQTIRHYPLIHDLTAFLEAVVPTEASQVRT